MSGKNNIDIIQLMQLPSRLVINTRIAKKTMLDNTNLSTADKKLIRDGILEMNWVAVIKPQNSNIPAFQNDKENYDEVHIIYLSLKKDNSFKKVAELFQKSIPYPLVLFLAFENQLCINNAVKQINQNDNSKRTIDEFYYSDWFEVNGDDVTKQFLDSIHFNKLSHQSLKHFYENITDYILNYQSAKLTGMFKVKLNKDAEKRALNRINEIEYELVTLRNTLSKATSFSQKVELNILLTNLNDEKNRIIDSLK